MLKLQLQTVQNKCTHSGIRKQKRKKEWFIGVNSGLEAKQSNNFQKRILLLRKSGTLAQS